MALIQISDNHTSSREYLYASGGGLGKRNRTCGFGVPNIPGYAAGTQLILGKECVFFYAEKKHGIGFSALR